MSRVFVALLVLIGLSGVLCTPFERRRDEYERRLSTANNELALNLHRRLSSSGNNVFFSPLSISTAFAMLHHGARGYTAEELRNALGYNTANLPNEYVHVAFKSFLNQVRRLGYPSSDYVLNSANSLLVDRQLHLLSSYRNEVQEYFHASVRDVDFRTDSDTVLEDINRWVREQTNGKIRKLLDDLSPASVMVLLNAVYFKGTWKYQFESEQTISENFYNHGVDYDTEEIPMMHITHRFNYAAIDDFQVLELPYKGDNISMVILLPNERDGLAAVEQSLDLHKIDTIADELHETKVAVSLPKFKMQYSRDLSEDIRSLGARRIFGSGDFSGMVDSQDSVSVSQVEHKAVVEVNEEGSEAAAVTGFFMAKTLHDFEDIPPFEADHPFLFAIVEKHSNMILFMGRVSQF